MKSKCQAKANEGFREHFEEKKIPSRGDPPQELRSASWQQEQLLKWKNSVRYWRDIWQLLRTTLLV